jgi:hypothetical protein
MINFSFQNLSINLIKLKQFKETLITLFITKIIKILMSILDEIRTVFINRIICEMHITVF